MMLHADLQPALVETLVSDSITPWSSFEMSKETPLEVGKGGVVCYWVKSC
jgi:hypothetical protein